MHHYHLVILRIPSKPDERGKKSVLHIMMHGQSVHVRVLSGDGSESVGFGVETDGKRDMLCEETAHLSRREPFRLWRLPVDEEEIGVLPIGCRMVRFLFLRQFFHDE